MNGWWFQWFHRWSEVLRRLFLSFIFLFLGWLVFHKLQRSFSANLRGSHRGKKKRQYKNNVIYYEF